MSSSPNKISRCFGQPLQKILLRFGSSTAILPTNLTDNVSLQAFHF